MEFLQIRALRGPNIWSRRTCLEVFVDIEELRDTPSNEMPGLYERLTEWLPGLIEHRCGVGERGGFLLRLREGTYAAHMLEHVTIELQNLAGTPVGFGKARETRIPGVYKVAMRYREEAVVRECLVEARELLLAAIHNRPYDIAPVVARLQELVDDVCIGPSTAATVNAAEARNIPVQRQNDGGLVQFGFGVRQRRIWTAETDRTSAIGETISKDKDLTKRLLDECGIPVPHGRIVDDIEDAWEAAQEIGMPVVVKPSDGNHGRGVFIDLNDKEEIDAAYVMAEKEGSGVIVEKFIRGDEHRLLVVGNRLIAAAHGESAWVVGDGVSKITELVDVQLNSDPRRGLDERSPLNFIQYDLTTLLVLQQQGYTVDDVPENGKRVMVQRNGNVSADVTDRVHPSIAAHMVLAAKVVGLDVAGIDVVAEDISRPLEEQGGAVVEVNAGPGLPMHLNPASGKPRPVGEAILGLIFSENDDGRIPVICVTGSHGKTSVTRMIVEQLEMIGLRVGCANSDGLMLGHGPVERGDRANWASARRILMNPNVDAAIFEAGAATILHEGLGFDRCSVAVVTNIRDITPMPDDFIESPDEMFTVLRSPVDVVLATGTAVLNAQDPLVVDMAPLCAGSVIFFSTQCDHPVIIEHCAEGRKAVYVRDGQIILAEGSLELTLMPLSSLPALAGADGPFMLGNVLAAVGAGWALHMPVDAISKALESYSR
jgi:cyanophycin synthetase